MTKNKDDQASDYKKLFALSNDLLSIADFKGYFIEVNQKWVDVMGYSHEELTTRPYIDFIHKDDVPKTQEEAEELHQGKPESIQFENRYLTNEGNIVWLEWNSVIDYTEEKIYSVSRIITDQKLQHAKEKIYQQELNKAHNLLKEATKIAHIGSWEVNLQTSEIYWSEMTKVIHEVPEGYEADVANAILFYKEGSSRDRITKVFTDCIEQGKPFDLELQIVTYTKKEKWVRVIGVAVLEDEKVVRVYGLFQNIDDKKKDALELSKLSLVASQVHNSVVITDTRAKVQWVNDSFYKLTGYRLEEVKGKNLRSFLQGEKTNPLDLDAIRKCLDNKESFTQEIFNYRKDGRPYWNELHITPIFDDQGNHVQFIGIQNDITVRKNAQENLRKSQSRYKNLTDTAPVGILVHSGGVIMFINAFGQHILEADHKNELIGNRVLDMLHPDSIPKAKERIAKLYGETIEFAPPLEEVLITQKGTEKDVIISGMKIEYEGRIAILNVFSDISQLKKAEKEILRMQKLDSLGVIAGGIAHDFNNLLTAIFGNLELAKFKLPQNSPSVEYLEEAISALNNSRQLTSQLLTFSKGGNPLFGLVKTEKMIRETIEFNIHGSHIKPVIEIQEQLWNINADKGQIDQVLANLTINALHAMPHGGQLYIKASNQTISLDDREIESPPYFVKIEFKDTGVGIPDEVKEQIFEPYFTTKNKGHGLGLAIVHSIITQHNGKIEVSSEEGQGTTFTLLLPAVFKEDELSSQKVNCSGKEEGQVLNILLMDDDPMIRKTVVNILNILDHEVSAEEDGVSAVARYKENMRNNIPFDIVIMDLTIAGGQGGKEAIKDLLVFDPKARVIASSGYTSDAVMANYEDFGFSGALAKPYTVDEMESEILKVYHAPVR
ncbi:MAG: PAS domain S-box protein [Reichenbachiella sp.]